ncbi:kinase-like domain-containing protein [Gigaspora rosea]|uniref:Kinase-like domain-containing protein n=1 Tax=Gigaspora rosea TaxID=44941 RepID=A0A397V096_9GLOM|nr:kinase-like domain-containing protein [Gigaspora rosea]
MNDLSVINQNRVNEYWKKSWALVNIEKYPTADLQFESVRSSFYGDPSLLEHERIHLINRLEKFKTRWKSSHRNTGVDEKRQCQICQSWTYSIQYCEFCIQDYLKVDFGNWTSGNDEIDIIIRQSQICVSSPEKIFRWIPYEDFEKVTLKTKGGHASIYSAIWKDGLLKWNSEELLFENVGPRCVILKKLENSSQMDGRWLEKIISYSCKDDYTGVLAECYGITQEPGTLDFILVLNHLECNLHQFLIEHNNSLTWKQKFDIIGDLAYKLGKIHNADSVHGNLHCGNILLAKQIGTFFISDLGFCEPIDQHSDNIYGNLPYIAPEVLYNKQYSQQSDIYSLGMIMWVVSTGELPFIDQSHDANLASDIVNGLRPKLFGEIPLEYAKLMEQCWDAMPENRPDALEISQEITKFVKNYYESSYNETYKDMESQLAETSRISACSQENTELKTYLHNSQLYCFKDFPQPKNATEEIKDKSAKIKHNGSKGKHFRFKINIKTLLKIKKKYLKKLKSKNTHNDNL